MCVKPPSPFHACSSDAFDFSFVSLSTNDLSWGCTKNAPPSFDSRSPLPATLRPPSEQVLVAPILVPPLRFPTSATVYAFSSMLTYFIQLPILGFITFHRLRCRIPAMPFCPSKPFSLQAATPSIYTDRVGGRHRHPSLLALSPSPDVSTRKKTWTPRFCSTCRAVVTSVGLPL